MLLIIISLIALGIGSAILIGNVFWNRSTSKLGDQLTSMSEIFTGAVYSPKMLDGLPLPVQRYFRLVLKEGQPLIRSARIIQAGEFRARKADNGWSRFEAKQYFSAQPPGFVWDAGIRMAPLMEVRVRDMYVAGQG
ncbi:MAG: DUF6544 family protein, partial [Gemmatimonadota bacterium]|nr:DUF6544 family protein [Gemmatimonadota bacterium]